MGTEKQEIDFKNLDRRVAARLMRRGIVNDKDLEKAARALPDSAEKCEPVETQLEDDELDELNEE
jgi:hypothetical protein